jgi:hypothetical protein
MVFTEAEGEEEERGDERIQHALDADVWEWASMNHPGTPAKAKRLADSDQVVLWITRTRQLLQGSCKPKIVHLAIDSLSRTPQDATAAEVGTLKPLLHQLITRSILHGGQWRPRVLDALGDALDAHVALRAAVEADCVFCEDVERVINAAVVQPGAYSNPYAFVNLAAAQRKLRISSTAFWEGVLRHDLEDIESRGIAIALHSLSTRYAVQNFSELPQKVSQQLMQLARKQARAMPGKDLTMSLEALAKMHVELDGPSMSKFREALREAMPYMTARQVASAVRASANLGLHFHGLFAKAINSGVTRTVASMEHQDLANTLYGLTKWTLKQEPEVVDALAGAVAPYLGTMRAVEVHDCLVSLARLQAYGKLDLRECVAAAQLSAPLLSPHMQRQLRWACSLLGAELKGDEWPPKPDAAAGRWEGGHWQFVHSTQAVDKQDEAAGRMKKQVESNHTGAASAPAR